MVDKTTSPLCVADVSGFTVYNQLKARSGIGELSDLCFRVDGKEEANARGHGEGKELQADPDR